MGQLNLVKTHKIDSNKIASIIGSRFIGMVQKNEESETIQEEEEKLKF